MSDSTIVTSEHLYQTIVQFDKTIVLPRKHATGNIHDCETDCPLAIRSPSLKLHSTIYGVSAWPDSLVLHFKGLSLH